MQEWISNTLESPTFNLAVLPAALILGILSSVGNYCNLPIIGAIAGWSGTITDERSRRDIFVTGFSFMAGTIIALALLGAVAGYISQAVEATMGKYWKFFAGLMLVFFGLVALKLVPIKLPGSGSDPKIRPSGFLPSMFFGLIIGGVLITCLAGCNPVLPIILGVVTLQGSTLWGAAILAVFAIGYSLPLGAVLIGLELGVGKLSTMMQKFVPVINSVAGVVLIGVGFYLLATV